METLMKQRLIGAVVLIALAVIFVPMLLDGSGRKESAVVEEELSLAPPKFNFESQLPDPQQLDSLPAAEKPSEAQIVAVPLEESEPAEVAAPQQAPKQAAPPPEPEVHKAAANKITPSPSLSAWAVQVAAFEEKGKALALEKKLRAGDLPAFTEKFEKRGKVLYRVRVGPELKRENADKLRAKIERDQGIKGAFVTAHP